jgi:hypothetical protein
MDHDLWPEFLNFSDGLVFFLDIDFFNIPSDDLIARERGMENLHQISSQHPSGTEHQYPSHLWSKSSSPLNSIFA